MKKISTLTLLLLSPVAMFAYYGDYESSSPSGWLIFLMIILIVWGILEVFLFFKIWGMANNVKEMKEELNPITKTEKFRRYRLLGQNDKAAEILIENFMDLVSYRLKYENYYSSTSLEEEVAKLEKRLSMLGSEIPENIKALKTYGDYYEMGYLTIKEPEKQETTTEK